MIGWEGSPLTYFDVDYEQTLRNRSLQSMTTNNSRRETFPQSQHVNPAAFGVFFS